MTSRYQQDGIPYTHYQRGPRKMVSNSWLHPASDSMIEAIPDQKPPADGPNIRPKSPALAFASIAVVTAVLLYVMVI